MQWGTRLLLQAAPFLYPHEAFWKRLNFAQRHADQSIGGEDSVLLYGHEPYTGSVPALAGPEIKGLQDIARAGDDKPIADEFISQHGSTLVQEVRRWRLRPKEPIAVAAAMLTGIGIDTCQIDDILTFDGFRTAKRGFDMAQELAHMTLEPEQRTQREWAFKPWIDFSEAWQRLQTANELLRPTIADWPKPEALAATARLRDYGIEVSGTGHWANPNKNEAGRLSFLHQLYPDRTVPTQFGRVAIDPEKLHSRAAISRRFYVDKQSGLLGELAVIVGYSTERDMPDDLYVTAQTAALAQIAQYGLIRNNGYDQTVYISSDDAMFVQQGASHKIRKNISRSARILKLLAASAPTPAEALAAAQ